jgi:hypothetical protein
MNAFKKYLPVLALVLIFGAAFQSSNSVPEQLKAIQSELSRLKPRRFYLTRTTHDGAEALTACAAGYHMASMWEILDPSNLRYDTELGFTRDDSGSGPPTSISGWIRTGSDGLATSVQGEGNCRAWTSAISTDRGTVVALPSVWALPPETIITNPWFASTNQCIFNLRVWCVQD